MSASSSASAAVTALRDQFGDRKPPDISRKITACVACRKQKIKCHMRDGQPPCTRCKKRGLPCTVNKSLQMILENDASWKTVVDHKLENLENALRRVTTHLSITDAFEDDPDTEEESPGPVHRRTPLPASLVRGSSHNGEHTPLNFEVVMDPDSGPAAIPGSVVSPVAISSLDVNRANQDIIARNVINVDQAQRYLDTYQDRLDHFLYRIIGDRRDLAGLRQTSPLLLAAICAVGALHLNTADFEKCYQEFVSIAASQTFSRRNVADDIRGLCVAAFWLSGISWTCVGAAVRMATELQLHRSISRALNNDRTHYQRTRLYYLVFVCDHQFSVAYGRPPMTRQDDAIRASLQFLETEHASEDDARLVSQVQFWCVGSKIYDTFGIDVERPLDVSMIESLRRFSISLDHIRADWTQRFRLNPFVGDYPRKGVGLHCHFAKLYLYSMAFRGIGKPGFKAPDVALDIDEIANSAILSATSIIRAVVTDTEIQSFLNGLPTYFDLMIAFAVVFVLKVSTTYASSVRVDTSEIHSLVANLVSVLRNITAKMHSRHLLVSVARGVDTLLHRCSLHDTQGPVPSNAHVTMSQPTFDESLFDMSTEWSARELDNFFMGEFDFLSNQDVANTYPSDPNLPSI